MALMNRYDDVFTDLGSYAANRSAQGRVDLSVRAASSIVGWLPTTPVDEIYEYFNIDFETAQPPNVCSFYNALGDTDGGFSPGNNLVLDQRGFKYIFQQEASSFLDGLADPRIHYNTTIKKVSYSASGVTITTDKGEFVADYAISTLSVGVLQHSDVTWEPSLPEWKKEGIYAFDMATYTKIFLNFPTQFWSENQYMLWADPNVRGRYGIWQNLNAPGFLPQNGSTNIFFVTVTATASLRVESMSDADVQDEIMELLRSIYGEDIPDPDAFYFPRWHSDPLFRGSYSNWPIGELDGHHDNMRAPLLNRLFFTGEAMSKPYFGFLQGAWIEGNSTGHAVAGCIRGDCPEYPYYVALDKCKQAVEMTKRSDIGWRTNSRFAL
jgi:polyamine oxidase